MFLQEISRGIEKISIRYILSIRELTTEMYGKS